MNIFGKPSFIGAPSFAGELFVLLYPAYQEYTSSNGISRTPQAWREFITWLSGNLSRLQMTFPPSGDTGRNTGILPADAAWQMNLFDGTCRLTLAKIREAKAILDDANVPEQERWA